MPATLTEALAALAERLGVTHAFAGLGWRSAAVRGVLAARSGTVVEAPSGRIATMMAAATAELGGIPALAVLDSETAVQGALGALGQARRDGARVVAIGPSPTFADAVVRQVAHVTTPEAALRALDVGRRGPVLIACDDPGAVIAACAIGEAGDTRRAIGAPDAVQLDEAARRLAACARPVIVVGIGARSLDDCQWVRAFAEALPAPVVATAKARGVIPEPHPLALGELGGEVASAALERADVVVALGVEETDLAALAWPCGAPVIDVSAAHTTSVPWRAAVIVRGAAALVLEELAPRVRDRVRADWDMTELDGLKRRLAARAGRHGGTPESWASEIVAVVREATVPGTMAVFDARWRAAAAFWQCLAPGELLVPTSPGVPGFAVIGAVAARAAGSERPIVCFTDAEGFAESLTALGRGGGGGFAIVALEPIAPALLAGARVLGASVVTARNAGVAAEQAARAAAGDRPVVIDAAGIMTACRS